MSIRPTSAAAFNAVDLSARQRSVYEALLDGPKTDHEIAEHGHMLVQSVCGARNRLLKMGVVRETSRTRMSPSGYDCIIWELATPAGPTPIEELIDADVRRGEPEQQKLAV